MNWDRKISYNINMQWKFMQMQVVMMSAKFSLITDIAHTFVHWCDVRDSETDFCGENMWNRIWFVSS